MPDRHADYRWNQLRSALIYDSAILQSVYGVLKEAEHRSTFYIPYWKLPLARAVVPRQRKFNQDLGVINECLDGLISLAKETRSEGDEEALQARDYEQVSPLLVSGALCGYASCLNFVYVESSQ